MINDDPNLSRYRIILLIIKQLGYTGVESDDNDDIILNVDVVTKWLNTMKKALAETAVFSCLPSWNKNN